MTIGDATASQLRELRASLAIRDALLAACRVARTELDLEGAVRAPTWDAVDELVASLIEALPTRSRLTTGPLTDGEPLTRPPALFGPGERRRSSGRSAP